MLCSDLGVVGLEETVSVELAEGARQTAEDPFEPLLVPAPADRGKPTGAGDDEPAKAKHVRLHERSQEALAESLEIAAQVSGSTERVGDERDELVQSIGRAEHDLGEQAL